MSKQQVFSSATVAALQLSSAWWWFMAHWVSWLNHWTVRQVALPWLSPLFGCRMATPTFLFVCLPFKVLDCLFYTFFLVASQPSTPTHKCTGCPVPCKCPNQLNLFLWEKNYIAEALNVTWLFGRMCNRAAVTWKICACWSCMWVSMYPYMLQTNDWRTFSDHNVFIMTKVSYIHTCIVKHLSRLKQGLV